MMIQMCPTEVRVHTLCTREVMLGLRVWIIYGVWVWVSHSHIHLCRQSIM